MLQKNTYVDLLACLSAATSGNHRHAANMLLGVDLLARMNFSGRRPQEVNAAHPVYNGLPASIPARLRLASLLSGPSKAAPASVEAAKYHLHADRCPNGLGYILPARYGARGAHGAVLDDVQAIAPELRALVVADIGAPAFAAARAPFADHYGLWETKETAMYGVCGVDVAPGANFKLGTRYCLRPGYSALNYAGATAVHVPAIGTYNFNFFATAKSSGTSNPTNIEVALDVGGVEVASWSSTRASANAGEFVEVGDAVEFLLPGVAATLAIDNVATKTITLRNKSGANLQTIGGMFVVWQ